MSGQLAGKIVAYGESGNLVTDIANDRLAAVPPGALVTVTCDEHQTIGIYPADHPEEPCTLLAILGHSGCLELTIIGDSAKIMLGVRVGEAVSVRW